MPDIKNKVKAIRESANMTQQTLADEVKATREYISAIENGHKIPSVKMLKKISLALNVSVSKLLEDENVNTA